MTRYCCLFVILVPFVNTRFLNNNKKFVVNGDVNSAGDAIYYNNDNLYTAQEGTAREIYEIDTTTNTAVSSEDQININTPPSITVPKLINQKKTKSESKEDKESKIFRVKIKPKHSSPKKNIGNQVNATEIFGNYTTTQPTNYSHRRVQYFDKTEIVSKEEMDLLDEEDINGRKTGEMEEMNAIGADILSDSIPNVYVPISEDIGYPNYIPHETRRKYMYVDGLPLIDFKGLKEFK